MRHTRDEVIKRTIDEFDRLDRLVALLTGLDSIRDTIAFPKTQRGACPLSDAPSDVDARQLQDLGLVALKKK